MIPSRATAMRCSELVQQAYATNAPRPMIASIDAEPPPGVFDRGRAAGVVLAFAGTRDAHDIELDAMAWHDCERWSAPGRVHQGFARALAPVYANAFHAVLNEPRYRVVVTGHSLGAALAVLAAYRIAGVFTATTVEVVAFGCPRVGDGRFHAEYHARAIPTLRIYRDWDPVASAPAWWGWRHVGDSLHLTRHGEPIADPTTPLGKLRRLLAWHVGDLDHSMPGYQSALALNARRGFAWAT